MAAKFSISRGSGLKGVAQIVAQQEPNDVPYSELRGRIFWFRRRAPEPLEPGVHLLLGDTQASVGKNGYVRFSLKTSDRREAAIASRRFAHSLDVAAERRRTLKVTRTGEPLQPESLPTREEIQHAAEFMYATLLAADEDKRNCGTDLASHQSQLARRQSSILRTMNISN